MNTKIFRRLSSLLFLFQIPCFAALQTGYSPSTNPTNRFMDELLCKKHPQKDREREKNAKHKTLFFGYIREIESQMGGKTIPVEIKKLCLMFNRRFIPCKCKVADFVEKIRTYNPSKSEKPSKDLKIISSYLEMYAIENTKYEYGKTPFLEAAGGGKLEVLKLLKKSGANINAKEKGGKSALHLACSEGYLGCVKFLLDNGANVHEKDTFGWTAFHLACGNGHRDCVELLAESGVDIKRVEIKLCLVRIKG